MKSEILKFHAKRWIFVNSYENRKFKKLPEFYKLWGRDIQEIFEKKGLKCQSCWENFSDKYSCSGLDSEAGVEL